VGSEASTPTKASLTRAPTATCCVMRRRTTNTTGGYIPPNLALKTESAAFTIFGR
jgi:hypothetical protein